MTVSKIDQCLTCGGRNLQEVMPLTQTPLTDAYQLSSRDALAMEKYPLNPCLCLDCGHLQLAHQVSPEQSYNNYLYNSQITTGLPDSFRKYAREITKERKLDVLDVGSNDGSFVAACTEQGHNAFGIEPSSALAEAANNCGRRTTKGYFDIETVNQLCSEYRLSKFDTITFNNVLANIPSPKQALGLAKNLLKDDDSEIYIQTGYHPTQFSKGLFDYTYHEHYSYFTISSMSKLAEQCNLKVVGANKVDIRGGSIRFRIKAIRDNQAREKFQEVYERYKTVEEYKSLEALIKSSKLRLHEQVSYYKSKGYLMVAYGASHSTGTLIHHFDVISEVDYLVDENKLKHGRFMPGTNLKVHAPDQIITDKKGKVIVVVLAWQYYEQIAAKLRRNRFNGPIIKPVLP